MIFVLNIKYSVSPAKMRAAGGLRVLPGLTFRRCSCDHLAHIRDSEQMNFLPHYNPELNKVIAAGQATPVAYNLYNIARVRA